MGLSTVSGEDRSFSLSPLLPSNSYRLVPSISEHCKLTPDPSTLVSAPIALPAGSRTWFGAFYSRPC